ncbi:MAG TPA: hypothetical protein VGM88_14120 [Kofleriaceae bacterium]|jgi:hypothetical protein
MRNYLFAAVVSLGLGACYAAVEPQPVAVTATADADVDMSTPDLVEAAPGVQVVADYDEPIFYSDGFYWRNYNGGWYRSTWYGGGWGYWSAPPMAIVRIDRPYAYAHYRPVGYVARHPARQYYRGGREIRGGGPARREEHREVRHEEHRETRHEEKKHR